MVYVNDQAGGTHQYPYSKRSPHDYYKKELLNIDSGTD
jgi:hypothetical protein